MLEFRLQDDGTFVQTGELNVGTTHGTFSWQKDDGSFDGDWLIEEIPALLARLALGGPYKYDVYRITEATKPELVIKPTCYGCGMIAGISCGFNPLGVGRDFTGCGQGDPLIDFNEDHQFSVSFPVLTKGKNYGQHKLKTVWFNSVRCANLCLLELTRSEKNRVVSYDYDCQTLGVYRAAQGFKKCPTCRRIHKLSTPFCDDVCESKYAGDVTTVLEVAAVLPQQAAGDNLRGRCAYKACGQGRDDRGNRVRARVPRIGDYCSKECRKQAKNTIRDAAKRLERVQAASQPVEGVPAG